AEVEVVELLLGGEGADRLARDVHRGGAVDLADGEHAVRVVVESARGMALPWADPDLPAVQVLAVEESFPAGAVLGRQEQQRGDPFHAGSSTKELPVWRIRG